jgi:hypothetical protein
VIDETAKTIAVTLPHGTSKVGLVATFNTTGVSVKVGATLQTSGVTPNDFTNTVIYTVFAADSTSVNYAVTVTVGLATSNSITAYSIAGQSSSSINGTAITVTMPYGTPTVTAGIATFSHSGASIQVGLVTQVSGSTPNDFTTPVTYTVTAANGDIKTYIVTVSNAPNSAKIISAYSITGQTSSSIVGSAITVTMPFSTPSVTNLVATFTASPDAVVTVNGVTQVSGTTENDFTLPVDYLVTAASGTTATYTVTVFVEAAPAANPTAPDLGEAGRFVILAYAGITGGAGSLVSNGDIGVTPAARTFMTGFTPSTTPENGSYNELVNGMSYAPEDANPDPFAYPLHYATLPIGATWTSTGAMLTQASGDSTIAYNFLAADPNPGMATTVLADPELGGKTLTRGVYKTGATILVSTPLQLDAEGDANAVWIFTTDGNLTTGATGNISFVSGIGKANNVYWRVAGTTTIAANTTFYGNVFCSAGIDVMANANVTGRLHSLASSVTLITDTVTQPAP